MKSLLPLACCLLFLAGCGNVHLSGEALTAAETSALHAWQANTRAVADPAVPNWVNAYLTENYQQWRSFVRSARKDLAWGPKLDTETKP